MGDRIRIGVDTGGTFTDLVALDADRLRHAKVLSTPADPSRAIAEGIRRLGYDSADCDIVHGSTVGTNAVLEGKGAPVAFVASSGFSDLLTLGRQERREVYALAQPEQAPPVPPERCFEVATRIAADGTLLEGADDAELDELTAKILASGVDAVAVNLLFSWLRPEAEGRIGDRLGADCFVSLSSEVLPEPREYERGVATWLNASVGPVMSGYLERLGAALPGARIAVMQSDGLTVAAAEAGRLAVRLLLSGPAGGLAAARFVGRETGDDALMTLDMGGTSTDVALLPGDARGKIPLTRETRVGPWPVPIPAVDMHTIGAGGGSIARVDAGGMLLVGPESAGADPGPACYGRGGRDATVTDAHVLLGRIPAGSRLGGELELDRGAAEAALQALGDALSLDAQAAAEGVIRVANEHMARALRVISVERGHDPREHALMCFGGAGGLHACELAELLGMTRVVIPAAGGVLSALGMLVSPPGRHRSQAWGVLLDEAERDELETRFDALRTLGLQELEREGVDPADVRVERYLDLRYRGQDSPLTVAAGTLEGAGEAFHAAHESAYGHRLPNPIEIAGLGIALRGPPAMETREAAAADERRDEPGRGSGEVAGLGTVPVWERAGLRSGRRLAGPAIVTEPLATAWVAPGWTARADQHGHLVLTREGG